MFSDTTTILDISDTADQKMLAETVTDTSEFIILGLHSSACESKAGNLSFPG